ncbi:dihydrofolate reductase [Sphingobacteriales bacterium UPWRP_1]|nr:hypothetical protein B6N25_05585 [Sphingobacteriales bacterium TSM_CSS]PSJ78400.1 dihydrofolate reductase [Sphingobacteriales bacterium UPWRP_1]
MISLIAAATQNRVIGKNGGLPWHLPNDMRYFKQTTLHHHVIMGRKTYSEVAVNKPLPQRTNIVITRSANTRFAGCLTANTLAEALQIAQNNGETEAFVIGGEQIYRLALPFAHRIYLTQIHTTLDGDAFFPEFSAEEWQLVSSQTHEPDEKHTYAYTFTLWQRKNEPQKLQQLSE